jgi:hypothetical protein
MTELQTELDNKSLTETEDEYLFLKSALIMMKYGRIFDKAIVKNGSKFIKKDKLFRKGKWINNIAKEFLNLGFIDLESTYYRINIIIERYELPLSDTYLRTRLKKLFDENYTFKHHTHLRHTRFMYNIDTVRQNFIKSIETGEYDLLKKYKNGGDDWIRVFRL